ncbi:MAG: ATP-dependent DNA helicase [Chloroflexota bacterium]
MKQPELTYEDIADATYQNEPDWMTQDAPYDAPPWEDNDDDDSMVFLPNEQFNEHQQVPQRPNELEQTDLTQFFGESGPLSKQFDGYEMRPSQLQMAEAIKRVLLAEEHAIIEAPTGTGKSIAYLIPALLSGKTVVVATANKSLQSQLYYQDIPFLSKVFGKKIDAVLVKGRSNFICTHKWEKELVEQRRFGLYDRENEQVAALKDWLDETKTGDIDDLDFVVSSDLRPRIVSFRDDCLQRDCRFYEDACFVNHMRNRAANSQVLITNHHLLLNALELGVMGERLLPPAGIYVIDEAHQLEQTATSVFEINLTDYSVEQVLNRSIIQDNSEEVEIERLRFQNTAAFQEVANLTRDNSFVITTDLPEMKELADGLNKLGKRLKNEMPYQEDEKTKEIIKIVKSDLDDGKQKKKGAEHNQESLTEEKRAYELAIEMINSTADKLAKISSNSRDESYVRYAARIFDRRHVTLEVHSAPINPATLLQEYLFDPELEEEGDNKPAKRSVICTSATLATNRQFAHYKTRCGIENASEELVLPAVFNYPEQALLYQPALPAYNWRNADGYYEAVSGEIRRLLEISRGRTLALFTSWQGLQMVNEQLTQNGAHAIWPLRAQGDAPRDALLKWFKETPNSVLLATRSFWEGVDIPGDDLSLVVLDKMPFPTPKDPLHSSRMRVIEDEGRSSFGEYMLPLMTLALKQGFGRLIRRGSDAGVVAILDDRLTSKSYGRQARNDLPPARFSRVFKDVHKFFQRTLDSKAEFALNVWAHRYDGNLGFSDTSENTSLPIQWRWQLLRLQDGKADMEEDTVTDFDNTVEGELYAAVQGLRNLTRRITSANRSPSQFSVEVRCSAQAATKMAGSSTPSDVWTNAWQEEQAAWGRVDVVTVERSSVK